MDSRNPLIRVLDTSPMDVVRAIRRRIEARRVRRLPTRLQPNETAALALMRADSAKAGPPFRPSRLWQDVIRAFEETFRTEGIQNPEQQTFNSYFSGFTAGDRRLHRYVCWMYGRILKQRDRFGLLEKFSATCEESVGHAYRIEDRLVSLDLLLSVDDFYSLYDLDPRIASDPITVAELGAGWGRLGYVLLSANPRATYCVFDLPEILVISQAYLPRLLPHVPVHVYSETRSMQPPARARLTEGLWFFAPQRLPECAPGTFDLVVNIASFQEMPQDEVKSYLDMFGVVAAGGRCFLRQLYAGKSHAHRYDEIEGLASYPFPTSWRRTSFRPSTLSDQFFEIGFELPAA